MIIITMIGLKATHVGSGFNFGIFSCFRQKEYVLKTCFVIIQMICSFESVIEELLGLNF